MDSPPDVRIDKWLWAVRLFKSRSLAASACQSGAVQVNSQPVKPSRSVKIGDMISAVVGDVNRTVKVIALLEQRVGAKLVPQYLEDLTPAAEFQKVREKSFQPPILSRPRGAGRPTKKDRRRIGRVLNPGETMP